MLLTKYYLYYLVEHYHYMRLHKCLEKQQKYLNDGKKFKKYGKKFIKHSVHCTTWQSRLDKLRNEIENKYEL